MEMNEIMADIRKLTYINELHELGMKLWDDLTDNPDTAWKIKQEIFDNIAKLRTHLDLIEDEIEHAGEIRLKKGV